MASVRDCAIFLLWSRSKVVYAMDELMLDYLSESSPTPIPTQVLDNLPHSNPYLLLPEPDEQDPQTRCHRTHIGVPLGSFVFGRYNNAEQLCSTADAKREDFGLMFVGLLDVGRGPEFTTLRYTIPLGRQTLTVENVVEATIAKFHFTSDLAEDDPRQLAAWLRRYVTQAFNSLLYVCTEQPDIEVRQPGKQRGGKAAKSRARRRSRPDDIDTVVKLSFRMGPALHAARTRWNDEAHNRSPADSDGPAKRPHQKRGHYRTYWTGPGRTIPTVRWIAPFWVNEYLLETDEGVQDVVVRPVRKRP